MCVVIRNSERHPNPDGSCSVLLPADAQVPARADSATNTEADAALPEDISHALAELRDAGGLSPRSKWLLTALAEAAALELAASAAAAATTARRLRLRRASFWGKVRVAVLATLSAMAAADVTLNTPTSGTASWPRHATQPILPCLKQR